MVWVPLKVVKQNLRCHAENMEAVQKLGEEIGILTLSCEKNCLQTVEIYNFKTNICDSLYATY